MWRRGGSSSAGRAGAAAALALAAAASCGDPARRPDDPSARDAAAVAAPSPRPDVTAAPGSGLPAGTGLPADATSSETAAPVVTLILSDDPAITRALEAGLRLALDESRAAGGPDLGLVVSATTPRWGSAVESAVDDAVERNALALVAPPERRQAHLLSQLATKLRLPVLSTSPAHSVLAAGSRYVLAVVPTRNGVGDEAPEPPEFDAAAGGATAFAAAFRARHGRAPGPWDAVGYDAGRCVVEAVRAHGLRRRGLVEAVEEGAPVRGAGWDLVFRANGACARRTRDP